MGQWDNDTFLCCLESSASPIMSKSHYTKPVLCLMCCFRMLTRVVLRAFFKSSFADVDMCKVQAFLNRNLYVRFESAIFMRVY